MREVGGDARLSVHVRAALRALGYEELAITRA
jgi:hypothetical protein